MWQMQGMEWMFDSSTKNQRKNIKTRLDINDFIPFSFKFKVAESD